VARETGTGTRSRTVFEALPTMRGAGALHPACLIARVSPRSRKKRSFEALTVGLPEHITVGLGQSHRITSLAWRRAVCDGQENSSPMTTVLPGDERGTAPCQGYRSDLQRHADATYVNVGTMPGSPYGEWASLRLMPGMGRSPRSSRGFAGWSIPAKTVPPRRMGKPSTGRRGAVRSPRVNRELRRSEDV
jgi:hypothetical protein